MPEKLPFDIEDDREEITSNQLGEISKLANLQMELENEVYMLEEKLMEEKRKLKKIQEEALPELLFDLGLSSIVLSTGQKITITENVYPSITKAGKQHFYDWLRSKGYGDIIKNEIKISFGVGDDGKAKMLQKFISQRKSLADLLPEQRESIHGGTLKAFVKRCLAEGINLPESILMILSIINI